MNKLIERLYEEIKRAIDDGDNGSEVRNYCNGIDYAIDIIQQAIDSGEVVVPRFSVGQEIWWITPTGNIKKETVYSVELRLTQPYLFYHVGLPRDFYETELFATEAEAIAECERRNNRDDKLIEKYKKLKGAGRWQIVQGDNMCRDHRPLR